jgi:eukaryotic-like serine/threonine-protein kinase
VAFDSLRFWSIVSNGFEERWIAQTFPSLAELSVLAAGGQKTVYRAMDSDLGPVVLKLFHAGSDAERVEREISAIAKLECPRVPDIYQTGTVSHQGGQVFWLIEQYLTGQTLRSMVDSGPIRDERVLCLTVATHVLEALAAAERHHIVHRDVKPENIMVDIGAPRAWLLDFGIARHLDLSSLTATESIFGPCTPGYAPPEQFQNLKRDIDARADLFSLGVTLYECVQGVNPFRADARDAREVLDRVATLDLPPISGGIADNPLFKDLVTAMTRRRRDHRPASAAEALTWAIDAMRAE